MNHQLLQSCTRVANGVKLSGSIHQLDYKGNQAYHHGCTELVYGFMGGDWSYAVTIVAGCPKATSMATLAQSLEHFWIHPEETELRVDRTLNKCIYNLCICLKS